MKCAHCGAEIGPDDFFCPGCGDPVTVSPDQGKKSRKLIKELGEKGPGGEVVEENNMPLIILAGVLSVLIVAVGVIGIMI